MATSASRKPHSYVEDLQQMLHEDVPENERMISIAGGAFLAACGLSGNLLGRLALLGGGGYMIYRGVTGRCPAASRLKGWAQRATRYVEQNEQRGGAADQVDEAAMQSFPASDAPSFSGSSGSPSNKGPSPAKASAPANSKKGGKS